MHDLAVVSNIQSITPIEGKDRIVLAKVENYDTIVRKDEFKVGDTVVYVFYDSILPLKPEFEFLRKRCWLEKWQGFRIRPMKMGGVVSEGLVLPMSILPEGKKYKLGQVVTDDLGIRYYDPDSLLENQSSKKRSKIVEFFMRFAWFRKLFHKSNKKEYYPTWIDKSDEENIEKCYDDVAKYPDTEYIISEKMEGMAATFVLDKNKFKVYSHNVGVVNGAWVEAAELYNIEKGMKEYCKAHGIEALALQGEVCGPSIQRNIYGFKTLKVFLYGGFWKNHQRLTWSQLEHIASQIGLETVPVFTKARKIYSLEEMIKDSDGPSVFKNEGKDVPREGLVWRTEDGKVHFKNKSRQYKAWFDNTGCMYE